MLDELFFELEPTGKDHAGLVGAFLQGRHTVTPPDLKPITDAWRVRLEKQVPGKTVSILTAKL
jgi:hypothetical protein